MLVIEVETSTWIPIYTARIRIPDNIGTAYQHLRIGYPDLGTGYPAHSAPIILGSGSQILEDPIPLSVRLRRVVQWLFDACLLENPLLKLFVSNLKLLK